MMRAEPHNSVKVAALLEDARYVDVTIENFGWDREAECYTTRYSFDGTMTVSHFKTHFHTVQFCPTPDLRFLQDYEVLEVAIKRHFGSDLHDLEV